MNDYRYGNGDARSQGFSLKLTPPLAKDLFSAQAEAAAKRCQAVKDKNKRTQIRRFYDELALWADAVRTAEDRDAKFAEVMPFIQMLQAKAAYAQARKLIDQEFHDLMKALLNEIKSPESLENGKLFFEAFLGYKTYYEEVKGK